VRADIASRSQLSKMLRSSLEEIGFGFAQAIAEPPPVTAQWCRPPLFTSLVYRGEPLQPHLAVPVDIGIEDVVDVYERFIAGYIRRKKFKHTDTDAWFGRHLKIGVRAAAMVFVRPAFNRNRLDMHLNLVQFAALVQYNFECDVEVGADTYVVRVIPEGFEFGVRRGELVTNLGKDLPAIVVRGLHSPTGSLADIARGEPVDGVKPSLFDSIYAWLTQRREQLGLECEPLMFILQVLWARGMGMVPFALLGLKVRTRSREALRYALKDARQWRLYERPLVALHEILVPQFLGNREFSEYFGSPVAKKNLNPVPPEVARRWDNALFELDPGDAVTTT